MHKPIRTAPPRGGVVSGIHPDSAASTQKAYRVWCLAFHLRLDFWPTHRSMKLPRCTQKGLCQHTSAYTAKPLPGDPMPHKTWVGPKQILNAALATPPNWFWWLGHHCRASALHNSPVTVRSTLQLCNPCVVTTHPLTKHAKGTGDCASCHYTVLQQLYQQVLLPPSPPGQPNTPPPPLSQCSSGASVDPSSSRPRRMLHVALPSRHGAQIDMMLEPGCDFGSCSNANLKTIHPNILGDTVC